MSDLFELEKDLTEFRDVTLELMNTVKIQGNRLYLLQKRDELLDKINKSNYDSSKIIKVAKLLELEKLEQELNERVTNEMSSLKEKILLLKKSHQGNQAYIASGYGSYTKSRFDKKY